MRKLLAILAAIGALLFNEVSARADFNDGMEAYNRGDYETARQEFEPNAKAGVPRNQIHLGLAYLQDDVDDAHVVQRNKAKAVYWFRKAARQGKAKAQWAARRRSMAGGK